MLWNIPAEILVTWIWFIVYMALIVHGKGPIGGSFFYVKEVQERVIELGLITRKEMDIRRKRAVFGLIAGDLALLFLLIVLVNHAKTFYECAWQFYVLMAGMELYDLCAVDLYWVAGTEWWDIPGTEDLRDLWHGADFKKKKIIGKCVFFVICVPPAALFGWIFSLIANLL